MLTVALALAGAALRHYEGKLRRRAERTRGLPRAECVELGLGCRKRQRLAGLLGSACHVFELVPG